MHFDFDIVGAFVPATAVWLVAILVVFFVLDMLLTRWGFYRWFWDPPLARFALFACLFCALGLFANS
jgi:protein AaeX